MITLTSDQTIRADQYLDTQHESFAPLGELLFATFGHKSGRISSQVRNLQQIVCSATRFADVEDFVKNQMGKGGGEAKSWRQIGDEMLTQLKRLREQAAKWSDDSEVQLSLRLKLARGWVRAVVGEYLYRVARDQMEQQHAER